MDLGNVIRCFRCHEPFGYHGPHTMGDRTTLLNYQSPNHQRIAGNHILDWLLYWFFPFWLNSWHHFYANCTQSYRHFSHPTPLTTDNSWQLLLGSCYQFDNHQYELINLGKHTRYLEIPFVSSITAWYTVKLNIWSSPSIKPWRYVVDFAVNWFQITPLAGGTSHHRNACLWTVATNCCHSLVPPESSLYPKYVKLIALNLSQWRRLVGRSWFVWCRDGLLPAQWWLTSASADTLIWIFFMIANV